MCAAGVARDLAREVKMLSELDSPHLVRLVAASTEVAYGPLLLVTELVAGGSLADVLESKEGQSCTQGQLLSSEQLLDVAVSVARGLVHLHERNVVHRDVKAANVLLTGELEAKLCDLGLARALDDEKLHVVTVTPGAGSPPYMSPEVMLRQGEYLTPASDVYSFGVLLAEMFTGKLPGRGKTYAMLEAETRRQGGRVVLTPEQAASLAPPMLDLIQRCTEDVGGRRPTMKEVEQKLTEMMERGMW